MNRGSLLYSGTLRVRSVALSIDDSGFEIAHRIECEAGGPGTTQQVMTNQIGTTVDDTVTTNGMAASFA